MATKPAAVWLPMLCKISSFVFKESHKGLEQMMTEITFLGDYPFNMFSDV